VIHGDLNVSNFFSEETSTVDLPTLWVFDFDQMHRNWFGFDIGIVFGQIQMLHFFQEISFYGKSTLEGFDADRFRKIFLESYREVSGDVPYLEPRQLEGFELYREFHHTALAVDVLFQVENGKQFEAAITGICELMVKGFRSKYLSH